MTNLATEIQDALDKRFRRTNERRVETFLELTRGLLPACQIVPPGQTAKAVASKTNRGAVARASVKRGAGSELSQSLRHFRWPWQGPR